MQIQISRKIIFYLFILLLLGTLNNKEILKLNLIKTNNFKITSLSNFDDTEIVNDIFNYKVKNLFFLKRKDIKQIIKSHQTVDDFYIFKKYPSNLIVNIEKTKFLALTKKKGIDYYIGSNGNFIKNEDKIYDLPFIFGYFEINEFLKLKNLIDESDFDFSNIKKLYFFQSKRWDIETKEGITIKLPRDNLEKSFRLLLQIMNKDNFKNIKNIDLRQNDQIVLNG
tara:strand:- start:6133 stop:6804 length:672 start_codon:yes stop_codon:yes gene_type:complete